MSTTLVTSPSPASAPPSLEAPTDRDLEIYKKVKISRIPQFEVAHEYGLHYSRVSQIVKDVHLWLIAGGQPTDPDLRDHAARQRLSRAAHQLRLLRCLELATDAMEADPIPLETTKRRLVYGREMWCEETKRDQPQRRLAAIRVVLRTTEALHKLEREGEAPAEPQPATDQDLLPAIFELLCNLRIRAAAEGRIKNTPDGRITNTAAGRLEDAQGVTALVASTINNLLGTNLQPPQPIASGSGVDCAITPPSPQTITAIDSRPLPSDAAAPASAPEPGTAPAPLNLSADPKDTNTKTTDATSPCADSIPPAPKENRQLERPAVTRNAAPPCSNSLPPPTPPSTSYTQQPQPPPLTTAH